MFVVGFPIHPDDQCCVYFHSLTITHKVYIKFYVDAFSILLKSLSHRIKVTKCQEGHKKLNLSPVC